MTVQKVKDLKMYGQMTTAEKRKLREILDSVDEKRKQQIAVYEKNFIQPLKQLIELSKKVRKNEISLDQYVHASNKWHEHMEQWKVLFKGSEE